MRAWQAIAYGSPVDCLKLRTLPRPIPGPGEVRVRVRAASLNPIDYKLLHGDLRRLTSLRFPVTLGFDASGIVDAVGAGSSRFAVGDNVYFRASRDTLGAFAEFSVQPEAFVALRPANLDAIGAASLPLVALTTVQGLVDRAHAEHGQRILIQAGSGGLGTFAIQYAKQLGLIVETTTSSGNADWVGALGADRVISYDRESVAARGPIYDIVLDSLGGEHTMQAFDVLKPGGVVVSVAGPPDREMARKFGRIPVARLAMWAMARKVYAAANKKHARYFRYLTESNGAQLANIAGLVELKRIHPVIDSVFEFDQALAAFDRLISGRAKGKIVLKLAD